MCHAWGQASPAKQSEQGYAADGINRLISRMLTIIVEAMDDLSVDERAILGAVDEHAMWHTFGTQSVADAVQEVLGYASPQTTLIYVRAEKKRVLEEIAGYYGPAQRLKSRLRSLGVAQSELLRRQENQMPQVRSGSASFVSSDAVDVATNGIRLRRRQ
jgi:hypothetical protein